MQSREKHLQDGDVLVHRKTDQLRLVVDRPKGLTLRDPYGCHLDIQLTGLTSEIEPLIYGVFKIAWTKEELDAEQMRHTGKDNGNVT